MKKQYNIIIAGAGGIAEAAGLLLSEWSRITPKIFIGNRTFSKAQKVARWIEKGATGENKVTPFHLHEAELTEEMENIFSRGDILLDCLPGSLAPRMARFARDFGLHYVNMTEYVAETNEIMLLAKNAETGFVLQSGIAPGYINVLAHGMFQKFCKDFGVNEVDKLEMKVGALTKNAIAPHFYGFTWSTIGVATEYIEKAVAIRNGKKILALSLSETNKIIINGVTYEDDLTSGGAADLPDALEGQVKSLDYKTLRYPGHYQWVMQQLTAIPAGSDKVIALHQKMEADIPHIEEDRIILYAAVEGLDIKGVRQRREVSKEILPKKVGKYTLRAIQTTTAAPMLQAAQMLLENNLKGVVLQSQIEAQGYLNGGFILPVYGEVSL